MDIKFKLNHWYHFFQPPSRAYGVSRMLWMTEILWLISIQSEYLGGFNSIPGGWCEKINLATLDWHFFGQFHAVKSPNNWLWDVGYFPFYWFGKGRDDLGCSSCATRAFTGDVAAFAEATWSSLTKSWQRPLKIATSTLQGPNIYDLGKRNIIFKSALRGDTLVCR